MYVKYNDILASGAQGATVAHSNHPECERVMHLTHPVYVKYNGIAAWDVQNASAMHFHSTECERGMHLKHPMYVKYNDMPVRTSALSI